MPIRGLRIGLTLLLAATVLLGGLMPPAVQHAHAGGDRAHKHHRIIADASVDVHGPSHSHRHASGEHSHAADGITAHSHRVLFGFDACLPLGEHQDVPDGSDVDGQQVTLARLLDSQIVSLSAPTMKWLFISLPSLKAFSTDSIAVPGLRSSRSELASLPLCDSARGERSGVQLI